MTETGSGGSGDSRIGGSVSTPLPETPEPELHGSGTPSAGDRDFDATYVEYFPFVWRCLRGLGVPPDALDDAAQEVFIVVHRRFAGFEGRSSVRTWLYGIVRNVASNQRRSRLRRASTEVLDVELASRAPGPLERAQNAEAAAFVQRFAAGLDAKKRDVFLLAVLEEMSMPEVAEALGIPLNTAYTRLRLVRAELKLALAEEAP